MTSWKNVIRLKGVEYCGHEAGESTKGNGDLHFEVEGSVLKGCDERTIEATNNCVY